MAHYQSSSDESDEPTSSTPTPLSRLRRSQSHVSRRSAVEALHLHQGTSHSQPSPSPSTRRPPPILVRGSSTQSVRRATRSASLSSSAYRGFRDDEIFSEDDEDEDLSERVERRRRNGKSAAVDDVAEEEEGDDEQADASDVEEITLKERQALINVEHPFGLPIWKPALYKKSRSVTRYADEALHSVPSAQAERHLLPGNIFWAVAFGWWLALTCFTVSAILRVIPNGGDRYSSLVFGLGWYLVWPFGKYVEGDSDEVEEQDHDEDNLHKRQLSNGSGDTVKGADDASGTIRGPGHSTIPAHHVQTLSWDPVIVPGEHTSLLQAVEEVHSPPPPTKSYGATLSEASSSESSIEINQADSAVVLGKVCFWVFLVCIIAPLMLIVCVVCWGLVVTIPMAKLTWALLKHLFEQPDGLRFCAAPAAVVVAAEAGETEAAEAGVPQFSVKHPRITAGQIAPSGSSKVLLCTYRAAGLKYYKYTVGGVNILFVNLMSVVFFAIFDGMILLPMVERLEEHEQHIPPLLAMLASQSLIFVLSLLSVIPLSYFIGMAVASISAQSSIGMGAVINATFGSIIEIILYAMMLIQGKGHLVEGSIVGSLLAGVLLMPGMSMVSSALRRKEQKFNAKSAGVTSMMLIMAIIGTLAPTLFYQIYGNFQLICKGCPSAPGPGRTNMPWVCDQCYYKHPDPVEDPFYQSTVKSFMYFCAVILVFSYLIGLWFSLRTHASQIWQNPQQVLHQELPIHNRQSIYHRLIPPSLVGKDSRARMNGRPETPSSLRPNSSTPSSSPFAPRRVSYMPPSAPGFTPTTENAEPVMHAPDIPHIQLPNTMTKDDFTRAVAVATVSALRQHNAIPHSPSAPRVSVEGEATEGGHGGHDAPSWSRTTSATVLMTCTLLYALIAEILVDVVDVILQGSGIDEKFLGVTLFALVPNTTEFMNAISFALNGNIALSMEIGSAYALQVCLLQIPAMVAFSAWWAPDQMGAVAKTFTLIFPRWDVVAIILSMFLMTYTYIEAKSNYHRGSILMLSYLVLTAGFYFAPQPQDFDTDGFLSSLTEFSSLTKLQYARWYTLSWWPF